MISIHIRHKIQKKNKNKQKQKNLWRQFTISRRDPYRLYDMLRYNCRELAS